MTQEKLEELYAYKGKEKFLSEISSYNILYLLTISLHIFLTIYISIICALFIFLYNIFSTLDINILSKYISLNIGKNNTFSSDLKNASLYLFAAQATLIGLIFPIVIAYVSLASVGRASSDKLMNIYKTHTGFNLLAISSFLLLTSYAFLFIFDSFFNISLFKIAQFLFLIWFVFNLYLIYVFLSKTIDFIYGSKKIEEITKYSYNHIDGYRDGFLVIADELSYFLENKNISRSKELEFDLVDFLQTNYIKHGFSNDDMHFFLDEIRKIIDNSLDYNNSHSIKNILYIYYYLGSRLSKVNQDAFINNLLEMNYIVLFDLENKLNLSNSYKDHVYSIFLASWDSWSSWSFLLKTNISKFYYNYYTFLVASFYIKNNRDSEMILDTLLRIPEKVKADFWNIKKHKTIMENNICDDSFINLCIETKFCIIKNVLESNFDIDDKKRYINSIIRNKTLLHGTTAIRSMTKVKSTEDLIFSVLRIIDNSYYSEYLNNMLDKSKSSNRVVNRIYWMDASSYLNKITETYAYTFDQFISNKSFPKLAIDDFLNNFDINGKIELLTKIDNYIIELEKINFVYDFFNDSNKIKFIKKRYVNLILQLRDHLQLNIYYSGFNISLEDKINIFYSKFCSLYHYLSLSVFYELLVWKNTIVNSMSIPMNSEIEYMDPKLILDQNVIYPNNYNFFDKYFLKNIINHVNKYEEKSDNPIADILDLVKAFNMKEPVVLIFCQSFIDEIFNKNCSFNIEFTNSNTYIIDGVAFQYMANYNFNCYGFVFNKNLINSIEVLYGNKAFDQSSIELISSPPPSFDLYFKINYFFNYKINFDLGYSLYLFMKR
ncbi:hypothetical protein [uncultured Acinetobacter sp.]|uniref:hypothetical protein n=1 Tax=uncultured Acinetobacter sp. TaxID=165433 RepID=UPI00258E8F7E|nr:hypothetical protein [uncultured Acinetobacter sp.]